MPATSAGRSSSGASHLRLICFALLVGCLLGLILTVTRASQRSARLERHLSEQSLRDFGLTASSDIKSCTATSRSAACKWAKKHSRATRKRPSDWKPKPGWPEDAALISSARHNSERALTALGQHAPPSQASKETLQSVLQSLWSADSRSESAITAPNTLPQCAALFSQPCIAVVGNANVSSSLQPELHSCSVVKDLNALSAASCADSPDVWTINSLAQLSLPESASNHQCSKEQVLTGTKAVWYLGGQQDAAAQLHSQDASLASIAAVHIPEHAWQHVYKARPSAPAADILQPSQPWTGLMTVLECARPDATVHFYPSAQPYAEHDFAAESELFGRMHASGLIVLHEDCTRAVSCAARPAAVTQQMEGLLTAPGMKLYVHRKKWQDSGMHVYNDEQEAENGEEELA